MADDRAVLAVNGRQYDGWKSMRVTLSIENIAGSFSFEVSDRWGAQSETWPIAEEDECTVLVGGEAVIDGFVDKRSLSFTATARALSYSGRDRAGVLVDCSAIVAGAGETGKKWTYANINVAEFARAVAAPYGVHVGVQPGLVLARVPALVAHPGETAYEVIRRAAADDGVLVVSDGLGGIIITRAGTAPAAALVQGVNVLSASVEYDAADRFRRYLISSQVPGTDEASGDATRVQAEATDLGVRRANRVILIRPDKGYNLADSRRRADWEARTRAARAEKVTIGVQGWRQPSGELWKPNTVSQVHVPSIGIAGHLLVSQVEFSIGDGGRITQLHLVRPDAFTPEPKATVGTEGAWKELAGGAF